MAPDTRETGSARLVYAQTPVHTTRTRRLLQLTTFVVLAALCTLAAAAPVAVRLLDALSGAPMSGQQIGIYEKSAGGQLTWRRGGTSDTDGWVRMHLPALSSGGMFVARAKPFALSIERNIPAGGSLTIAAGPVRAVVRHGVTGAAMPGTSMLLVTQNADGRYSGVANVTTDSTGQLRLDLKDFGAVRYALRGTSPVDGSNKYSPIIASTGDFEFRLGNPAVTLRLTDWANGTPIIAARVEIRERLQDGTLEWFSARETDGDGRLKLDLDGLSAGRRYSLRMTPYLQTIERDITAAGWLSVRAGAVPATVLNGDNGQPLANTEVLLLSRESSSAPWTFEHKATTTASGALLFDPKRLGSAEYVLRAASTFDGSVKYSSPIATAGAVTFAVGNRGLTFRVTDAGTSTPIAALQLIAQEQLPNGGLGPSMTRVTDDAGVAKFDLEGLGQGRKYKVRTKPYLHTIERIIENPGWVDLPVGVLRVKLLDGATGRALPAKEFRLLKLLADGSRQTVNQLRAERDGSLKLDPSGLGDVHYQLSAASPADGTTKYSAPITGSGDFTFTVGSAGVLVRVNDWASGAALPSQPVTIFELNADDTRTWVANRNTDALGRVRFDLDGLDSGRRYLARLKPYLQVIEREITATGVLDIKAGNVRVNVARGDNHQPMPNTPVKLLAVSEDGNYEGISIYSTSAAGQLILDLPDLDRTAYVLRAASPVDGSLKYSTPITRTGTVAFRVGNAALNVTVTDFLARTRIPNTMLQLYELQSDGARTWVNQRATNANGVAVFDLDGLGSGRKYVLRARPFAQWLEYTASTTGTLAMEAGRATVMLFDQDSNRPMAGISVQGRSKAADGTLSVAYGGDVTDASGSIRFDPPDLGAGAVAVFAAVNPFNTGVHYYSDPTITTGVTLFGISRSGPKPLDRTPAELSVIQPRTQQAISTGGLILGGKVADQVGLRDVVVELRNGSVLVGRYVASIDQDLQQWRVSTPALNVPAGTRLTVKVMATDSAYNATSAQMAVTVADDVTPPTIAFRTPAEGSVTNGQGLSVFGNIRDNTQWRSLSVRLESATQPLTTYRNLEIDPATGDWAFAVPAELMKNRTAVSIRARGTDTRGNFAEAVRNISIDPNSDTLRHLLSRITFGESPPLYEEARRLGFTAYLDQQLAPALIDDSQVDTTLAAIDVVSLWSLRHKTLLRMSDSRRQLNEVMTWFWENHFNTDNRRHGHFEWEQQENEDFRRHALGNFSNLLRASAHSPAMLYYLDNTLSQKRMPNENYARELLELHTVGSSHTQADIDDVARALTGWTVLDGAFSFTADRHDDGEKRILGKIFPPGGGEADGDQLLSLLASHPATARHICRKLAIAFVTENPTDSLVTRCANLFRAQSGAPNQIAQVVRFLVTSAEFRDATTRKSKVKTSLEFALSAVRSTLALRSGTDLPLVTTNLGQPLFTYPSPDGYSLLSEDWNSPFLMRTRLELIGGMLESYPTGQALHADPGALLAGWPSANTTEGIAARCLQNAFGGAFDAADLATARNVLTDNGTRKFAPDAPDAEARIERLVRTVLSMPRYQLR